MPRQILSPVGLNQWLEFFQDKTLPVRASTQARLHKALEHPSSNLLTLAPIVRTDPVLCLHITRAAQALLNEKDAKLASLEHAIQTLGFDRVREVLDAQQPFRLNPGSTQHTQFMRAVADSHHASTQVTDWLSQKQSSFTEEARLASLLYGFIHWLAWLYAPLHKEAYQRKVLEEGVDVALAEHDIFGCTLQELGFRLAQRWNLPSLTIEALSHDTSPSSDLLNKLHLKAMGDPRLTGDPLREINHFLQQPFFAVKLSNWLALTVTRGWNTPKAHRLLEVISDYLRLDSHTALARLHSQCAESARQYHLPGVLSPAAEMLLIPSSQSTPGLLREAERQQLQNTAPTVSLLQAPPARPQTTPGSAPIELLNDFKDKGQFERCVEQLRQPASSTKPALLLQLLLKGLHEGLGLNRVCILQRNPGKHQLKTLLSSGFDSGHLMTRYENNLEIPSLFKRMCDKPTCVWYNSRTYERLQPLLPADFEACLPTHDWLMMSLFDQHGAIALVYADMGEQSPPITEFYSERFRFLGASTAQALKHLTQVSP